MNPSVTNTLINGTVINGSKIDQNFTDIINGLSDGTKDFNIKNLECTSLALTSIDSNGALSANTVAATDISLVTANLTSAISSRIGLDHELNSIDTSSAIVPTASRIEINSAVYQYATFAAGIDIITGTNDKIDFTEDGVTELTATIPAGTYTGAALATAVEAALNLVGANLYTCLFYTTYFKITSDNSITLLWRTGTNWTTTCGKNMGIFTTNDATGTSFTSDYAFQIDYTDELATITTTNFTAGSVITVYKTVDSNSKVITIKNGTGNIICGSDRTMTDYSLASFVLIGANWKLLSYSAN